MNVVLSTQERHKRPVISSPGSHISAFCQGVISSLRISRCSAQDTDMFCLLRATRAGYFGLFACFEKNR